MFACVELQLMNSTKGRRVDGKSMLPTIYETVARIAFARVKLSTTS
jgi:hypothetical protein